MTFRNTRGRLVMALSVFAACLSLGGGRACAQFAVIDAASLKEATLEAQQSLQRRQSSELEEVLWRNEPLAAEWNTRHAR